MKNIKNTERKEIRLPFAVRCTRETVRIVFSNRVGMIFLSKEMKDEKVKEWLTAHGLEITDEITEELNRFSGVSEW